MTHKINATADTRTTISRNHKSKRRKFLKEVLPRRIHSHAKAKYLQTSNETIQKKKVIQYNEGAENNKINHSNGNVRGGEKGYKLTIVIDNDVNL